MNAATLNASLAVEFDFVRLERLHWNTLSAERLAEIRLSAALYLCSRLDAAEALLSGVEVPAHRLDPAWVRKFELSGDVVLDDELALRVNARGPLNRKEVA
jgi:hypothetical protein